jgi:gluconokinase
MRQGLKGIMTLIVMGPAGSGKSTIGRALAARLQWDFIDADDLHDTSAKAKMSAGKALTDTDRRPWLLAIHEAIVARRHAGQPLVCACSALTREYRRLLAQGERDVQFLYLDGPPELLAARLRQRRGHFFAPQLLESQLELLQPPQADEALVLDIRHSPEALVDQIIEHLSTKKGP